MIKPVLYILMRNDLPSMNTGKAMAQASHASNAFIEKFGISPDVENWQKETRQGFGTVLVLSVNIQDIFDVRAKVAENNKFMFDVVIDPTYPYHTNREIANLIPHNLDTSERVYVAGSDKVYLHRSEITCAYIFGDKSELTPVIGHYGLHP